jgi:hypothetical protein
MRRLEGDVAFSFEPSALEDVRQNEKVRRQSEKTKEKAGRERTRIGKHPPLLSCLPPFVLS